MKFNFTILTLLVVNWFAIAGAENFLYLEQTKTINGAFEYRIPRLELNSAKMAGKFFGNKCYYLSEFEGALVYTAPRASMMSINHHSIEANWSLGVEIGPIWVTYSIGGRQFLAGNDSGIPAGLELSNTARLGVEF
jgi:hypothetical protein